MTKGIPSAWIVAEDSYAPMSICRERLKVVKVGEPGPLFGQYTASLHGRDNLLTNDARG